MASAVVRASPPILLAVGTPGAKRRHALWPSKLHISRYFATDPSPRM